MVLFLKGVANLQIRLIKNTFGQAEIVSMPLTPKIFHYIITAAQSGRIFFSYNEGKNTMLQCMVEAIKLASEKSMHRENHYLP